jgi:hypothetical protein
LKIESLDSEKIVTGSISSFMLKMSWQLQKIELDVFTAEEFLEIDDIVCVESVTEEEIINLVLNKENEDVNIDLNDNNNIEPVPITHAEVKKSLQTIISFVNNIFF